MPKILYTEKKFSAASLRTIQLANEIIEEYQAQGFDLTLRQLYYQFVSRDLIPNSQKDYNKLGNVISDARLAGLLDWEAIVDRTRSLRQSAHWSSPREIVEACASQFKIDKWADQDHRIEVWIEKDALIGVIEKVCRELDVPYFSCRGYTSQSEMWAAGQRLLGYQGRKQDGDRILDAEDWSQTPIIIHLGDHDPSGMDMSRDIFDRLELFMGGTAVKRIALNTDQVQEYKPPPNPAKVTDPRAGAYIKKFGTKSWELDALDPKVIEKLIRSTVGRYRDAELWKKAVRLEQEHRASIAEIAKKLK